MKKVALLLLAAAVAANAHAQGGSETKNMLGFSPFRLWNGLRFKYERTLSEKHTIGGTATLYYGGVTPGFQLAPTGRFYFKRSAPEGLYLQAKVVAGLHALQYSVDVYRTANWTWNDTYETERRSDFFSSFGAGLALGYQVLWGKDDRWSLDLNIGLKGVSGTPSPEVADNEVLEDIGGVAWYTFGPGSWVDGLLSIGYRF